MNLSQVRWAIPVLFLSLFGCAEPSSDTTSEPPVETSHLTGIQPNIKVGDVPPADMEIISSWVAEAVDVFQSPEFETNFRLASELYPELFVSRKEDLVPTLVVLDRLKTQDVRRSALLWPETFITLTDEPAARSSERTGYGFDGSRKATAGQMPGNPDVGQIELGRVHLARYRQGDTVEKSCALNTMVHEISHTLSEWDDKFWMHILDSEDKVTAPKGVFEASYFIGTIAQCTYLQKADRISNAGFHDCMMTFSDPKSDSRFKSLACDDFPDTKPVAPQGRLLP